ncbi:aspartyl-phosphate phosphatase Spo0E family protein [Calderihabitans maritimus]|uniref:Sporulation stage 0, Spo0E-like regulatory phosphatase n=1 Tax=Calderihabitans maritimus TaxID=1246530 RepID=A0A1Z5HQ55_9FIRM|nr:aspartyl-phosphate phosphatase Spo0E family protein [Calderihabitans maritimus]GAW91644.1 sporulation stage 0, Spo0E-like regulatory phosphatase [Calderihabitans maritimus]
MTERDRLNEVIRKKQGELYQLVEQKESLTDREVYDKSCELDRLVVEYMKMQKMSL